MNEVKGEDVRRISRISAMDPAWTYMPIFFKRSGCAKAVAIAYNHVHQF